jgi:hypothetical protein
LNDALNEHFAQSVAKSRPNQHSGKKLRLTAPEPPLLSQTPLAPSPVHAPKWTQKNARFFISILETLNEFGKSFTKAFEENVPKAEMSRLIPGLIRMGQVFSDQKKK